MNKRIVIVGLFILLNAQSLLLLGTHNSLQDLSSRKKVGYYSSLPVEEVELREDGLATLNKLAHTKKIKRKERGEKERVVYPLGALRP